MVSVLPGPSVLETSPGYRGRLTQTNPIDLEILLRGLGIDTLLLCGGLTDVCVHYTFVDGHQSDYFCRVIEDCVAAMNEQLTSAR